jgi:hypothetical protein
LGEVRELEIKEMPIEEKYDKLLDFFSLYYATSYAFNKEQGTEEKWPDYLAKVMGNMMPSLMGSVAKIMKTVAPGKTFRQSINQMMYMFQMEQPLSNLELTWISDREATIEMKNCEILKRMQEVVKKADLNIDTRELCKSEIAMHMSPYHPSRKFGMDLTGDLKENGCIWTFKLK